MLDWPQAEDVMEMGEGALKSRKSFVSLHGVDGGEMGLLGLDAVFALVRLLAGEVDGMLEETKDACLVAPAVITVAMIAGEDLCGRGADLLGGFEPPLGDALRKLLEACPHAVHGLRAVRAVERPAIFRLDDEHTHARLVRCHLLHHRLRPRRLLTRRDADRAFDPGAGRRSYAIEDLSLTR